MWLDHAPFLIGHIALVTRGLAAIVLSGRCGPHGNSWVGIRGSCNRSQPRNLPFEVAFLIISERERCETSSPTIFASGRGCCCAPGCTARRLDASLSDHVPARP